MRITAFVAAVFFVVAFPASAQVKKWVDEEGTIHLEGEGPPRRHDKRPVVRWALEFSWTRPVEISYPKLGGGISPYLVIVYKIRNGTDKKIAAYPKITMMADGSHQYDAGMHPLVHGFVERAMKKKYEQSWAVGGALYPGAEKVALAVFGPWNRGHKKTEVLVDGIAKAAKWDKPDPIYHIVYQRNNGQWEEMSHGWMQE
ncbi:hypothetical protein MYX64_09175 [Nitrospinae bacterium AH_259_B05_G02_I21]|nr:hypothetical protein [Nitrospinae bacterium AH_259_B05_G02_I21]